MQPLGHGRFHVLVEFSGAAALLLFEIRIVCKEHIGEIVIAKGADRGHIHAACKKLHIMRLKGLCRLPKRVYGALYINPKVPRERGNRDENDPRRQIKFLLAHPPAPRHIDPPCKRLSFYPLHRPPPFRYKRPYYSIESPFHANVQTS